MVELLVKDRLYRGRDRGVWQSGESVEFEGISGRANEQFLNRDKRFRRVYCKYV